MGIKQFLIDLNESGRVLVSADIDPLPEKELESTTAVLRTIDSIARRELAFEAPQLDLPLALWAAERLYRGCQFIVHREADELHVREEIGRSPPTTAAGPAAAYSVDLSLRHLPGLMALCRSITPTDPLLEALLTLGNRWPLSSVGIEGATPASIDDIINNPTLRQLYVDRIIARGDTSRLCDPRVNRAVRAARGIYGDLTAPLAGKPVIDRGEPEDDGHAG